MLFDDVMLDVDLVPALRISGELACWNGSTISDQVHLHAKEKVEAKDYNSLKCYLSMCVFRETLGSRFA